MNVRYFSERRHGWDGGEDWIFIHRPEPERIKIVLDEGHHHWFNGGYYFDREGKPPVSIEDMSRPGPFEILLEDPGDVLLSLTVAPFKKSPVGRKEEFFQIDCGNILPMDSDWNPGGGEELLSFFIRRNRKEAATDLVPRSPIGARNHFLTPDGPIVPPQLRASQNSSAPFELAQRHGQSVCVFSIGEKTRAGDFEITEGKKIPMKLLEDQLGKPTIIPAGATAPTTSYRRGDFKACLPVLDMGDNGLVGDLFLFDELFEECDIDIHLGSVYAILPWHLPKRWLSYRLEWAYFCDEGWLHQIYPEVEQGLPQSKTVNYNLYATNDGFRLCQKGEFRDWGIRLKVTPSVFGKIRDEYQQTIDRSLH